MIGRACLRAAVVAVILVAMILPRLGAKAEGAAAPDHFGRIVIDVSHLAEIGGGRSATLLDGYLATEAREVFADRLTPADRAAPTLVIKIRSLSLAAYAGADSSGVPGMGNTDYLEGDGFVMSGKQVLATTHILSALDASYSGGWNLPDIDDRRLASISHHFAYWLRREMGL